MYLEYSCSIQKNAVKATDITVPGLYPNLYDSDLPDAQYLTKNKENNLQDCGLYPDLAALVKPNNFPVTFGKVSNKAGLDKLDAYSKKVENKLKQDISIDLTTEKPKPKARDVSKKKNCNEIEEEKHTHLRRGFKVLAFTVGLPITLIYLMLRTTPYKEDNDIKSEFDQMASSTASFFKRKGKKSRLRKDTV